MKNTYRNLGPLALMRLMQIPTGTPITTLAQAKAEARKVGMVITKTEDGEYRVSNRTLGEAGAYYTNDLEDAVGTAKAMAQHAAGQ